MSDRPFTAIFPKPIEVGDRVILKGKIREDATKFSVNFTLDCGPIPAKIAYHFKTVFREDQNYEVIQNHKYYEWGDETRDEVTWIDGPGHRFHLEFVFTDSDIFVYTDTGYQYKFEQKLEMNEIKTIQIWDDLEYLESLTFEYNRN